MRIKIVGIVFCCFVGVGLNAQNLSLGPNAGFGHTWMSKSGNSEYQPAGNVGLALTYSTESNFGIGTELKYSIEGGRTEAGASEFKNRLDYLRIPLKLMYFFGDYGDRVRPKVSVGPSFGFLVGGEREVRNNDAIVSTTKAKDLYKSVDAGIGVSAGLNYRLIKNTWLVADLSYYNGLTNVYENSSTNSKNRNIGVNVGVNFGIGSAK